ncbi:MAG: general stress protein CsbD [Methylobacter sp.]|nr:MAG: general stress protein CsbD [Methylobacter sp.]PPD23933.1 MAG: general stress protein CsbD [Methylobacter sp.]
MIKNQIRGYCEKTKGRAKEINRIILEEVRENEGNQRKHTGIAREKYGDFKEKNQHRYD